MKTVRAQPWYVNRNDFEGESLNRTTVYVLLGKEDAVKPVRHFVAKNKDVAKYVHQPIGWKQHGFMPLKALEMYENNWGALLT